MTENPGLPPEQHWPERFDWVLLIVGFIITIVATALSYLEPEHKSLIQAALVGCSVATTLFLVIVSFLQSRSIRNYYLLLTASQKENSRLAESASKSEKDNAALALEIERTKHQNIENIRNLEDEAKRQLAALSKNNIDISSAFRQLAAIQSEYDASVLAYFAAVLGDRVGSQFLDLEATLKNNFEKLAEGICTTASIVIPKYKKRDVKCSTNLKLFVKLKSDKKGERGCIVLTRCANSNRDRLSQDEKQLKNPPPVKSNKAYWSILHPNKPNDYIIANAKEFALEIANDAYFDAPTIDDVAFYDSALSVPILGNDSVPLIGEHTIPYDEFADGFSFETLKDQYVFGILCIDSEVINFFNRLEDLHILSQLAHQAFAMIRSYYAARIIATRPVEKRSANH